MGWPLILCSLTFLEPSLPMHVWFCWLDPYNVLYYHFWPQKPLNSPDYGPKTTITGCDHRINGHPAFLEPPWVVLVKKHNRPSASFMATPSPSGPPLVDNLLKDFFL